MRPTSIKLRSGLYGFTAILLSLGVIIAVGSTTAEASSAAQAHGARATTTSPSYIYWGIYDPGAIGRANLNGTGVNQSFIEPGTDVAGLTFNSSHLYWSTANGSNATDIGRAKLNGSGVNSAFITTDETNPCGVAVSSTYIYWVGDFGDYIGRANLNGTGVDQNWLKVGANVCYLALNSSYIYWGNYETGDIGRANLSGSGVKKDFVTTGGQAAVAVDSSYIYFGSATGIGRANLNGTGVNDNFIAEPSSLSGLAVNGSHIYWAPYQGTAIGRAKINGTGVNDNFITDLSPLYGVAVSP